MKKMVLIILVAGMNVAASEQQPNLSLAKRGWPKLLLRQADEQECKEFESAVNSNDVAGVKKLLGSGISPNSITNEHYYRNISLVGHAVCCDKPDIIKCLVAAGANFADYLGQANSKNRPNFTWLEKAVRMDNVNTVSCLIDCYGTAITQVKNLGDIVHGLLYLHEYRSKHKGGSIRWKLAKKLVKLNPAIIGDGHPDYSNAYSKKALSQLKQELLQEGTVLAVLMLNRRNGNQLSRLDNLVKGEFVKYLMSENSKQ